MSSHLEETYNSTLMINSLCNAKCVTSTLLFQGCQRIHTTSRLYERSIDSIFLKLTSIFLGSNKDRNNMGTYQKEKSGKYFVFKYVNIFHFPRDPNICILLPAQLSQICITRILWRSAPLILPPVEGVTLEPCNRVGTNQQNQIFIRTDYGGWVWKD